MAVVKADVPLLERFGSQIAYTTNPCLETSLYTGCHIRVPFARFSGRRTCRGQRIQAV